VNDIWLGDLLRCIDRLGPLDETREGTVARLLGMAPQRAVEARTAIDDEPAHDTPTTFRDEAGEGYGNDDAEWTPAPPERPRADRPRLEPIGRRAAPGGQPWEAVAPLETYQPEVHRRPLPHEPLLKAGWTREILAAALATRADGWTVDEPRMVEEIANARPVSSLPRLPKRTLVQGVQVLLDVGEGMLPYRRDQYSLAKRIAAIVGVYRTTVLRFSESPLRGAGTGGRRAWADYVLPEPQMPVLALTDLGIGGPPDRLVGDLVRDWLALAAQLDSRGSRLIVLVPYPPRRWPTQLARHLKVLHWDRPTTVADVLDRLR
jgi:hypothetical protein